MDLKFARKFNIKLAVILLSSSLIDRTVAPLSRCDVPPQIYGYAAMKFHGAALHCAAVFCTAECELCVRCSAPLKTHRKRAKFNRSSSVKF